MDEFIYCYVIRKWDYPSRSYFSIPITSRDSYTSKEIHTDLGFGFAVCEDCYKEEWKRRKYYENVVRLSKRDSGESK